jgi:hypothetical protein
MNIRRAMPEIVVALTVLGITLSLTLAQNSSSNEVTLFDGTMSSYAKLNSSGKVTEAGVIFPLSINDNAPMKMDMGAGHGYKVDAVLEFPEVVRQQTYLNHLGLFWNPMGHEPEFRYGTPHWDFHFFSITPSEAAAIDCKNLQLEKPEQVAPGWLGTVAPNQKPDQMCVPLMGFHSLPLSEFTAPGVFQAGEFEKVMISGFYQGQNHFIEPMLTKALLEKHKNFSLPVPLPTSVGKTTLYPTKWSATYIKTSNSYKFAFTGFKSIN